MTAIPWGPGEVLCTVPCRMNMLVPTDDLSISPEIALFGEYEHDFCAFLERHIRPGMTCVDVGANLGLFTVMMGALVGEMGEVYAVEPNPEAFAYLENNVRMNWLNGRVHLRRMALARNWGTARLSVPDRFLGCGSLVHQNERSFEVETAPFADIWEGGFIDFLKIDVEAAETSVLDGASRLVKESKIGVISLEYREDIIPEPQEMRDLLVQYATDYDVRYFTPTGIPLSVSTVLDVAHYSQLIMRFPKGFVITE